MTLIAVGQDMLNRLFRRQETYALRQAGRSRLAERPVASPIRRYPSGDRPDSPVDFRTRKS